MADKQPETDQAQGVHGTENRMQKSTVESTNSLDHHVRPSVSRHCDESANHGRRANCDHLARPRRPVVKTSAADLKFLHHLTAPPQAAFAGLANSTRFRMIFAVPRSRRSGSSQ